MTVTLTVWLGFVVPSPLTQVRVNVVAAVSAGDVAEPPVGSVPGMQPERREPAPGGPILVVTSSADPFTSYYTEILRAEGLNEFATADFSTLSAQTSQKRPLPTTPCEVR